MQGNGTYGLSGQLPLTDKEDIPEMFRREGQGTDIWIANFIGSENWQDTISRAVLSWFWPAIHWKIIVVRVGDKEFNADNLYERMNEFFSPEERRPTKPFNPLHFFEAYINPEKKLIETSDTIGDVAFYGRTDPELPYPNKTALVRNTGMIIDFKSRSSHLLKYAAIFECRDENGSAILRKLENPSHTEWNWHNWKDENGSFVENGKKAQAEFENFIADSLLSILYAPVSQSTSIPGLTEYIGLPSKDGVMTSISGGKSQIQEAVEEETGIEIGSDGNDIISSVHTIRPTRVSQFVKALVEDSPNGGAIHHTTLKLNDSQTLPLVRDENSKSIRPQELINASVRYIMSNNASGDRLYRIIVRTDNTRNKPVVRMRLYARSDNGSFELLPIRNVIGEKGTQIVDKGNEHCDFSLDDSGSAFLSVDLSVPWILALEPNLRILL
jgi:hypothetical protein